MVRNCLFRRGKGECLNRRGDIREKNAVHDNGSNHECGTVAERLTNRENVPDTSFEPEGSAGHAL